MSAIRHPFLICSAVIEALEGAAAIAFGIDAGQEVVFGKPSNTGSAVALALVMIATGGVLIAIARGLFQRRPGSRTPAIVTQLFAVFIGYNLITSDQQVYGVPMVICGAVALVLLLTRPITAALNEGEDEPPSADR